MTDWQPIETAPKDGTVIIVTGGTAHWNTISNRWFSHQTQGFIQWQPTHWMPLPAPPQESDT